MPFLKFTVDSQLLEELGERLIGKSYIALAELVKNGFDADAKKVTVKLDPDNDQISVVDIGHGMSFEEFRDYWMRVGSRHKERQKFSRDFKRRMTGSKGIGRLAVQYLANELRLSTTSKHDLSKKLSAHVVWSEAVRTGDLTEATVQYDTERGQYSQGTSIILSALKTKWDVDSVKGLAREIWWLQPPFRSELRIQDDSKRAFQIEFFSPNQEYVESFNKQMHAILDIWYAKLIGKNDHGRVNLSLEFAGRTPIHTTYEIPPPCTLQGGDFEIRIYLLQWRQPEGIKVNVAREYLNEFGGVHVYDGGFHLPYYGDPRNDWLKIEFDHSHRLSTSELLPKKYQIEGGMSFLPTLSRILGVVNVSTSKDRDLKIVITRDRLQETMAFANLRYMIRWATDFYAVQEAKRALDLAVKSKDIEALKVQKIEDVLKGFESEIPEIPKEKIEKLRTEIKKVTEGIESDAEAAAEKVSFMGPLATAGITSLAYQHELNQQFRTIERIIVKLGQIQVKDEVLRGTLNDLTEELSSWLNRAKTTNALFAYFRDSENLLTRKRFQARKVIDDICEQVKSLARDIPIIDERVDDNLLLPRASVLEWSSIFQNVFINAFNAMIDSKKKVIEVSSRRQGATFEILVQDTGSGVDLSNAESLFEPFERRTTISPERRALGYGGTGLGLTIVHMIANNIRCEVSFVEPEQGFATAFSLKWRETQ